MCIYSVFARALVNVCMCACINATLHLITIQKLLYNPMERVSRRRNSPKYGAGHFPGFRHMHTHIYTHRQYIR